MLPLIDRVGVGVHVGADAVRLVALRRRLGRLHAFVAEEPRRRSGGEERPLEEVLGALRAKAPSRFVVTALPLRAVRCAVLEVPDYEDHEDRQAWAASQAEKLAGGGPTGSTERSVVRFGLFGAERPEDATGAVYSDAEVRYFAVVAVAREDAVDRQATSFAQTGFEIERVASGVVELASLLAEGGGAARMRVREGGRSVGLIAQSGRPIRVVDGQERGASAYDAPTLAPIQAADSVPMLEQSEERARGGKGVPVDEPIVGRAVYLEAQTVEGEQAPETGAVYEPYAGDGSEGGVPLRPLASVLGEDAPTVPFSTAAALAYEALYPGLALVDFLDETARSRVAQAREKERGQRSVLAIAAALLVVLLVLSGAQVLVGTLAARTEEVLAAQAGTTARLDREERRVEALRRDLETAREAERGRTSKAPVLEALGRAAPEGVVLTELVVEDASDGGNPDDSSEISTSKQAAVIAVLRGVARSSGDVGTYSLNIEALDFVRGSSVSLVERLTERDLRRSRLRLGDAVVRFEITCEVLGPPKE